MVRVVSYGNQCHGSDVLTHSESPYPVSPRMSTLQTWIAGESRTLTNPGDMFDNRTELILYFRRKPSSPCRNPRHRAEVCIIEVPGVNKLVQDRRDNQQHVNLVSMK